MIKYFHAILVAVNMSVVNLIGYRLHGPRYLNTGVRGPQLDSQGGGAGVFVAGKLFISTGLGGALKISHFVTCLYGTVLEVNYLFHAESSQNYLFQKYSCPPPPLGI